MFRFCHLLFDCHWIINLTNFSCNISVFRSWIYPISGLYHSCFLAYEQVYFMRFKFPTAVCIKVAVFHDVISWNMLRYIPMFQKDLLPPYSGRKAGSSKMFVFSCQLNSFTFRKTIILHVFHLINTQNLPVFSCTRNFFIIIFTSLRYWHI